MSMITKVSFPLTRTWSNQLLKILLIKMFSNHSDFCFHITIHKILDKKSLYCRKNFISEKKTLLKFLKKTTIPEPSIFYRGKEGVFFLFHSLPKWSQSTHILVMERVFGGQTLFLYSSELESRRN